MSKTQWRKCRRAVNTIAISAASQASTTSWSRCDPPGWMIARTPASIASWGPSANGKNASEASAAPSSGQLGRGRLVDRDPHRVDAAHLPGSDPDRAEPLRHHDRVRAHVLAHRAFRTEARPTPPRSACASVATSISSRCSSPVSRSCDQDAAAHALDVRLRRSAWCAAPGSRATGRSASDWSISNASSS